MFNFSILEVKPVTYIISILTVNEQSLLQSIFMFQIYDMIPNSNPISNPTVGTLIFIKILMVNLPYS